MISVAAVKGGGRKVGIIIVQVPNFEPHQGPGGPWVLLLSKNKNHVCANLNNSACVSEEKLSGLQMVLLEPKEKIRSVFEQVLKTNERKALKTGGENYIKVIADLARLIICEKFNVEVVQSK
jgi:hypothetical protein